MNAAAASRTPNGVIVSARPAVEGSGRDGRAATSAQLVEHQPPDVTCGRRVEPAEPRSTGFTDGFIQRLHRGGIDDPTRAGNFDGVLKLVTDQGERLIERQQDVDRDPQIPVHTGPRDEAQRAGRVAGRCAALLDVNDHWRRVQRVDERPDGERSRSAGLEQPCGGFADRTDVRIRGIGVSADGQHEEDEQRDEQ